jgi:hypothetical protein
MITVLDNFFDDALYARLLKTCASRQLKWELSRTDANEDIYLTHHVYGKVYDSLNMELFSFSDLIFEEVWNETKKRLFETGVLGSSYINGLLYGMEAHPHIDTSETDFATVICYLTQGWNIHWGGETVFYDKPYSSDPAHPDYYSAEIIKSVLPKPNRVVVFQGNIMHSVRALSKSYKGTRATLMFKVKNVDFAKVAECIAQ